MSVVPANKSFFWALASLAAVLPTLPLSPSTRTTSAVSLVGLATGVFAHRHLGGRQLGRS